MKYDIELRNVSLLYKNHQALTDISFSLKENKIYGLIGRNGAGKTSLLSLLASLRPVTDGTIRIAGEDPFENPKIMQNIAIIHEVDYKEETTKVKDYLKRVAKFRPNYDKDYERYLIKKFKLSVDKPINKLSKGMQSVLNVIIGLSSRSPITIFDEAYLGMDAPTRVAFYKELLDDQENNPRLIIFATHLVSEMDYLFDEVLILHNSKLLVHEDYESLVSSGITITGPQEIVDEVAQGRKIIGEQQLGRTKAIMIYEKNNEELERRAREKGLDIGPVSLQDLFIHLTED